MTEDDATNSMTDMGSPYGALQTAFGAQELKARDRFYDIDSGANLVDQLKEKLGKSETGERLLKVADHYGVEIRLIKSTKLQSSVHGTKEIFLSAEAGQKEIALSQLLELGGALRELEQNIVGYGMPSENEDPFEKASRIHTKYLDKIVHMCKIGHELTHVYGDQVTDVLNQFGIIDIYEAYINNLGHEAMGQIYTKAQEEV